MILYNLNEKVNTENFLKDYYDYRFFDRPFYSKFVYDKEKDSAFIDNDNNLDAFSCHDIAPNVYFLNNFYTHHIESFARQIVC